MSRRTRLVLSVLGIVIVLISIAALVYAAWPTSVLQEQVPIAPTLLTPP